jgi:hypothetical protein
VHAYVKKKICCFSEIQVQLGVLCFLGPMCGSRCSCWLGGEGKEKARSRSGRSPSRKSDGSGESLLQKTTRESASRQGGTGPCSTKALLKPGEL